MTVGTSCIIGEALCAAHTAPHKLCLAHGGCVSTCWTILVDYGTPEHAAELSRALARERVKTETLERTRDEWKKRAEESERVEDGLLAEAEKAISEAREELARQIKIKMMMSEGRERFLRALQGISSEPCASRLVSGRACDQVDFLCASCKAKRAIGSSL